MKGKESKKNPSKKYKIKVNTIFFAEKYGMSKYGLFLNLSYTRHIKFKAH